MISLLLKLIYVLSFNDRTLKKMMIDENILLLVKIYNRATQEKRKGVIFMTLRVLSFLSRFQSVMLEFLTMENVRFMF